MHIDDPYAVPGPYRKVQLHCHTTASDGSFSPAELLRMYKDAGYAFVFITDHNRVTRCDIHDDETFLALPGTEDTVSRLRPLGPHLLRLFVAGPLRGGGVQGFIDQTAAADGLCGLCHPSWTGNLWTGAWPRSAVQSLRGYHFVEIRNPHSRQEADVLRWEAALRRRVPPVWGVAVDDCHRRAQFNRGWIAARVPRVSAGDLRDALRRGAFYASTGPSAEFDVTGTVITARFEEPLATRFVDAQGRVRQARQGTVAEYDVHGDEQFVRVEAVRGGYRIWSQPFLIHTAGEIRPAPGAPASGWPV